MKWNQFQFVFQLEDPWAVTWGLFTAHRQQGGIGVVRGERHGRSFSDPFSDPFWMDVNVPSVAECIFSGTLVAHSNFVYKPWVMGCMLYMLCWSSIQKLFVQRGIYTMLAC